MSDEPTLESAAGRPFASRFYGGTVGRPVALMVALVTLVVIGMIAYARIPIAMLPDGWAEPSLGIYLPNPGSTAQENEEKVARVVEEQLRTLSGIERTRSWSDDDGTFMYINFDGDLDMDLAKADVRDRLERARPQLPETVDRISLWSEDGADIPIIWFAILYDGDNDRADYLLEKYVRPRLEAVPGVGRIEVWGAFQDSVHILLDEQRVIAAGLDIGGLIRSLSADNFALPMGEVDDGGRNVILRSDMRFRSVEEIAEYPVGDGLRLKDLGRVERRKAVGDWVSRVDGAYSYFCMITKDSQSNVVETSRKLREAIDELRDAPELAGQLDFVVFGTQGDFIEAALGQMRQTANIGGLFAVVVLLVFLKRIRLTLCVALSIPISVLLAMAFEYFRGSTLNVLTMAGLTLVIGMLVDNSVVVVENIARMRALGLSARRAAVEGTREIGLAVTLATLTSVVVFLPLIFMSDHPIMQVAFAALGFPLCVALCFSLLVALVFLPVIAARILGPRPAFMERLAGWIAPVAALPVRLIAFGVGALRLAVWAAAWCAHRINRAVLRVLGPRLVRLTLIAAVAGIAVWSALRTAPALALARKLGPFGSGEESSGGGMQGAVVVAVLVALVAWFGVGRWRRRPGRPPARPAHPVPAGSSLIEMVTTLHQRLMGWTLEHRFWASAVALAAMVSVVVPWSSKKIAAFGEEEDNSRMEFGVDFESSLTLSEASEEVARYERFLEENRERYGFDHWRSWFDGNDGDLAMYWDEQLTGEQMDAVDRHLRENLPKIAGHEVRFQRQDDRRDMSRSRKVAVFKLRGPDSDELERLGAVAIAELERRPELGLSSISSPLSSAPDQIRVELDRDLAHSMGVRAENALQNISWALRGWSLPRYHDEGREIPFVIEFDEDEVAGLSTLRDLSIYTGTTVVPLSSFAKINLQPGRRSIYRENGKTSFSIQAEVAPGRHLEDVWRDAQLALASSVDLPRGYSWGEDDSVVSRQEDEMASIWSAFGLSVVLILLLMGILFESVLLPFSVLFTIPFAIVGALWVLFLSRTSMDTIGWIGMIILAGVVVNNGIVLVDRIHQLRRAGTERSRAVLEGCSQRVRPVLMTALTTVFGLTPMIFSEPATNSFDYRALATCISGGLVTSTFFTLWVVPLAYTLLDDLWLATKGWTAWWVAGLAGGLRRRRDAAASAG